MRKFRFDVLLLLLAFFLHSCRRMNPPASRLSAPVFVRISCLQTTPIRKNSRSRARENANDAPFEDLQGGSEIAMRTTSFFFVGSRRRKQRPLGFPLHFLQSPLFLVSKVSNYCRLCQQLSPPGLPPVGKGSRSFEGKKKKKQRGKKKSFFSFLSFFFFSFFLFFFISSKSRNKIPSDRRWLTFYFHSVFLFRKRRRGGAFFFLFRKEKNVRRLFSGAQ